MRTAYRSPAPVTLTFDDGPIPSGLLLSWMPWLVSGHAPRAARYASLIFSMRERGHDIGFHCVEHVPHDAMTRREIEADVESGLLALGRSVHY